MASIFKEEATVEIHAKKNDVKHAPIGESSALHVINELGDDQGFRMPESMNIYENNLLCLAEPVLAVLLSIPRQERPYDLGAFRIQLLDLLRDFKGRSVTFEYHPSVIEKSTYILCAALDEAVAHTEWGRKGGWVNHSLLASMFTQRNGGEIFFVLLDKACQQPKLLKDFIELCYILLVLGFRGKFAGTDENELYEIKSYVYSLLDHYIEESNVKYPKDEKIVKRQRPFAGMSYRYLVYYVIILLILLFSINLIKFNLLNESMDVVFQKINEKSEEKFGALSEVKKLAPVVTEAVTLPMDSNSNKKDVKKQQGKKDPNSSLRNRRSSEGSRK